jgi:predicted NBD/HSP70 family sugar kinase
VSPASTGYHAISILTRPQDWRSNIIIIVTTAGSSRHGGAMIFTGHFHFPHPAGTGQRDTQRGTIRMGNVGATPCGDSTCNETLASDIAIAVHSVSKVAVNRLRAVEYSVSAD